jgi:hypothetical protein
MRSPAHGAPYLVALVASGSHAARIKTRQFEVLVAERRDRAQHITQFAAAPLRLTDRTEQASERAAPAPPRRVLGRGRERRGKRASGRQP